MPKRAASESVSDDSLVLTPKKSKKAKVSKSQGASGGSAPAPLTTPEGDEYWEIPAGSKRRLTVSMFKSMPLVSVREYYEAGGEMKPGKKGISLTVAQFAAVIEALPAIEKSLKKKGHVLPRPVYVGGAGGDDGAEDMDEDEDEVKREATDDDEEEEERPKRREKGAKKGSKVKSKRNIEMTSDEEEDEE